MRLANVYGPGMAANNVMSDILGQVPGDGPLVVRDIAPVRDYLWIEDAAPRHRRRRDEARRRHS